MSEGDPSNPDPTLPTGIGLPSTVTQFAPWIALAGMLGFGTYGSEKDSRLAAVNDQQSQTIGRLIANDETRAKDLDRLEEQIAALREKFSDLGVEHRFMELEIRGRGMIGQERSGSPLKPNEHASDNYRPETSLQPRDAHHDD